MFSLFYSKTFSAALLKLSTFLLGLVQMTSAESSSTTSEQSNDQQDNELARVVLLFSFVCLVACAGVTCMLCDREASNKNNMTDEGEDSPLIRRHGRESQTPSIQAIP